MKEEKITIQESLRRMSLSASFKKRRPMTIAEKENTRNRIVEAMADYLAQGNKITVLPPVKCARVGNIYKKNNLFGSVTGHISGGTNYGDFIDDLIL